MYEMHKNITFNTNELTYTIKYIIISRVNDYTKRDVNQGKNIRIWRYFYEENVSSNIGRVNGGDSGRMRH